MITKNDFDVISQKLKNEGSTFHCLQPFQHCCGAAEALVNNKYGKGVDAKTAIVHCLAQAHNASYVILVFTIPVRSFNSFYGKADALLKAMPHTSFSGKFYNKKSGNDINVYVTNVDLFVGGLE